MALSSKRPNFDYTYSCKVSFASPPRPPLHTMLLKFHAFVLPLCSHRLSFDYNGPCSNIWIWLLVNELRMPRLRSGSGSSTIWFQTNIEAELLPDSFNGGHSADTDGPQRDEREANLAVVAVVAVVVVVVIAVVN